MIQNNTQSPDEFRSKDRSLVLILLALGKHPLGVKARGGVLTFRFDREEVKELVEAWFGNQPIPLADARRFVIAMEIFTSYVRAQDEFSGGRG